MVLTNTRRVSSVFKPPFNISLSKVSASSR
jgi:hypothetical protein